MSSSTTEEIPNVLTEEQAARSVALTHAKTLVEETKRTGAFSGASTSTSVLDLVDVAEYILSGEMYEDARKTRKRLRREGETPIHDDVLRVQASSNRAGEPVDPDGQTHDEAMATIDAAVESGERVMEVKASIVNMPAGTSASLVEREGRQAVVDLLQSHGLEFQAVDVTVEGNTLTIDVTFTDAEARALKQATGAATNYGIKTVVAEQIDALARGKGVTLSGTTVTLA